jgi:hypothetical protein
LRDLWRGLLRELEVSAPANHKMSDTLLMEYVGFESQDQGRQYRFQVRYAIEDMREFTLTISTEAFDTHRVRYQDAPDVCSLKLRRELAANANHPSMTNFPITDTELEDYKVAHAGKVPKSPYAPRPREDY